MKNESHYRLRRISFCGIMTALLAIFAPISIPLPGLVPISLTGFFVYLSLTLLGPYLATASYAIYLLIGLLGLPVFSNYRGGVAVLLGPTGGYLVGFLLLIPVAGFFAKRGGAVWAGVGMVLGTAILYTFGTAWYVILTHNPVWSALLACVFPFLIPDAVKMILAYILGVRLRITLEKSGILGTVKSKNAA